MENPLVNECKPSHYTLQFSLIRYNFLSSCYSLLFPIFCAFATYGKLNLTRQQLLFQRTQDGPI